MEKNNRKVLSYYLYYLKGNKPMHTRIFNYIFNRFLVILVSFMFFIYLNEGEKIFVSFIGSIFVLIIYQIIYMFLEKKRLKDIINKVNEKIARKELWEKIQSLDKEGFVTFIKEILENLPEFKEVEETSFLDSEGIDIICKYKDELVAVQCHLLDGENTVEARSARELSRAMSRRKYKKGIIISTTDFRESTIKFCDLIKDKRKIVLLNWENLVEITKESNKFPSEEKVRDIIIRKMEHKDRIWRKTQEKLFNKTRVTSYFIYGTFLILIGLIFNFKGNILYYFCSLVLYLFGIIGIFKNISLVKKDEKINWKNIF